MTMNFGEALEMLKKGAKAYRNGWNGIKSGQTMYIEYVPPTHGVQMGYGEYLQMVYPKLEHPQTIVGWLANQTDMLSEDWHCFDFIVPKPDNTAHIIKTGSPAKMNNPEDSDRKI